ncbi:NADH dehydrogenase [ubiquinone] 1 alpha subcomplex subunit 11-like [Ylistrum balloti]|uniref:NADH dehydrogenase [ubiquinone] 1 alpha subcomplex subunit 11-like n=1 Tax=Ylistrum balloti TaxID=509963 RepID=UPI0029059FFB|nr:NADH dehydrogenase [ubiquinone] 1 alpha subcomplex subunit 11-like [Ylistrum balloti]
MESEEKQSHEKEDGINDIKGFILHKDWKFDWHVLWTIPDGQQTEKKAATACSFAAFTGLSACLMRCYLGPAEGTRVALTALPSLGLFGSVVGPSIVSAATYVYVTSYAAEVRGKSEPMNHFYGGAAAGAVYGLRHLNFKKVAVRSIGFAVVGMLASELSTLPGFSRFRGTSKIRQHYLSGNRWRTPSNINHD